MPQSPAGGGQAGESGAEAFHIPQKWGRGEGQDNGGALCWSSQLLGSGGDPRNPRSRMLGMPPLGGNQGSAGPSRVQGQQEGTGARAPGWWVSWEPPPGVSAYGGEGLAGPPWQSCWESGHRPCGWQAKFWVARVLPSSGPHPGLSEPPQHMTQGPPTGLHSAGTSPELMEPETSDHDRPAPGPHGGLPRLHELSPAWPVPQDDTRIRTPLSRRRPLLPSATAPCCGRGQVGR